VVAFAADMKRDWMSESVWEKLHLLLQQPWPQPPASAGDEGDWDRLGVADRPENEHPTSER
jgi:hypothetical protein